MPKALVLALFLSGAGAAAEGPGPVSGQGPAQEGRPATPQILVISRQRLLAETAAARHLAEAEERLTADLQARIDRVKAELAAEEQALVQARNTLDRAEFDARVAAFDARVRRERRQTQMRAQALQSAFRDARVRLLDALAPILVKLSRERGAAIILDLDQILVAHPSLDVTDEALALFDAEVPPPELPTLDEIEAAPDPEAASPSTAPAAPPRPGGERGEPPP